MNEQMIRDLARLEGCTCTPTIKRVDRAPGLSSVLLAHKSGCPLCPDVDGEIAVGGLYAMPSDNPEFDSPGPLQ